MIIVRIRISKREFLRFIRASTSGLLFSLVSLNPTETSLFAESVIVNIEVKEPMPAIVEDWQWVVMTIIQEAANEPFEGQIAVAEVIRDRASSKYNCDGTIVSAVLSPYQFSGWNSSDKNRVRVAKLDLSDDIVATAIRAYNMAFKGSTNYAKGANLYHADWLNVYPEWTRKPNVTRLTQIGRHIFYREAR